MGAQHNAGPGKRMKVPFRDGVPASGFGGRRHDHLTALADRLNVREAPGRRLPTRVAAFKALATAPIH